MINKIIKIVVIFVVILIIVVAIVKNNNNNIENEQTFKIGVVLPLSGPAAILGELSKNSVELAISNLSEEQRENIEIIYGDDQFNPKETVSVVQKLINVDKVDALITYGSPSSVAAAPIAESNRVPLIGLGNSPEVNADKEYAVRLMLGPEAQSKAIEELLLRDKYKKIGIIWNQSDGPKSVHDELINILENEGYDVVLDEGVTKNEKDFKTSITKIREVDPDVVVVYISPQSGVFTKQARDLGIETPFVGGPVFELADQIKAAEGTIDNQPFVSNDNAEFLNEYYSRYGVYPTIAGDYVYDAITMFARASEKTKNSQKIMDILRNDFEGVSGHYKYNGDGSFDVKQVAKIWDGEKFEKVN